MRSLLDGKPRVRQGPREHSHFPKGCDILLILIKHYAVYSLIRSSEISTKWCSLPLSTLRAQPKPRHDVGPFLPQGAMS